MLAELVASQGGPGRVDSRRKSGSSRNRRFPGGSSQAEIGGERADIRGERAEIRGISGPQDWRQKSGNSRRKSGNSRRKSGNSRNVALTRGLGCPRAETDRAEIDGENKKFAATERKLAERDFRSNDATFFRQWQTLNNQKPFP